MGQRLGLDRVTLGLKSKRAPQTLESKELYNKKEIAQYSFFHCLRVHNNQETIRLHAYCYSQMMKGLDMQVSNAVGWNHARLDIPDDVDPRMQHLMRQCWEDEPEKRPDFDTIIDKLREIRSSIISAKKTDVNGKKAMASTDHSTEEADSKPMPSGSSIKEAASSVLPLSRSHRRSVDDVRKVDHGESEERDLRGGLKRSQSLTTRLTLWGCLFWVANTLLNLICHVPCMSLNVFWHFVL